MQCSLIKMMNPITIEIPGLNIAGKSWGSPKNPPILALHGWLDNANSFDPLAHYLQEQYYLIAIDLPGHGLSSHIPLGSNYHFIDGLLTIVQIIKALNYSKIHLLGHSLGACLASLVAGIAPDRILSLSLIEALGPLTSPAHTTQKQLAQYAHLLLAKEPKEARGYKNFEQAALARSMKGYIGLKEAHILCERGTLEKNGLYYWRHDRRLITASPLQMTEEQVLSCLKKIEAKTYLILANQGFSFNEGVLEERIRAVHSLEHIALDGGHHIHMEQPEILAGLLAAFIN